MKKIICILMLLPALAAYPQKQNNIWYFGLNAGVDFNGGTPVALLDGQVTTYEGSASVADANGSLLFYTDGITVYNKLHQPMENGTGLMGNTSTTQVIIVQKPGSETLYYIFTAAAGEEPGAGLRYTEVDAAANDGLGVVTENKNVPLNDSGNEQITATFHHNGTDIWVVNRDVPAGNYYAFLVTPQGVSATPVVSPGNGSTWGGYMKISPDGSKLATANLTFAGLCDFNNNTGAVNNPVTLTAEFNYYGLEFSPSGKRLYISMFVFAHVVQFDLEAEDIPGSAVVVQDDHGADYGGALQRASDGKIYLSNYYKTSLTVINNPDALGTACNIVPEAVDLGGREAWIGLPFAIWPSALDIGIENVCLGTPATFSFTADAVYESVLWDFGDGNASAQENPTHSYTAAGTYTVTFTAIKPGIERVVTKEITITPPPQYNLGGPYTSCRLTDITIAPVAANFDPAQATWLWEFNGQPVGSAATLQPQEFGTYTLTVVVNGCSATQNIAIMQQTIAAVFSEGCAGNRYMLSAAPEDNSFNAATATYSWTGPDGFSGNGQQVAITEEGTYTLTVTTAEGCVAAHIFNVTDAGCAEPDIPKGVSPNGDGKNDVFDLTQHGVGRLDIFNRYGLEVFSQANYTTQWYGQTNNGDILPDGTYYYRIQKSNGINITGWVYVNRENR